MVLSFHRHPPVVMMNATSCSVQLRALARQRAWHNQVRQFSKSTSSNKQQLVILGSGWGGYPLLRSVDKKRWGACSVLIHLDLVQTPCATDVTVISPTNTFNFTPLLAGCAVGTLEFRCATEPVWLLGYIILLALTARCRCEGTLLKLYVGLI